MEKSGNKFKIGLTQCPIRRFEYLKKHHSFNIQSTILISFTKYDNAFKFEKLLHKRFKVFRTKVSGKFSGYTEFFYYHCFHEVFTFVIDKGLKDSIKILSLKNNRYLIEKLFS